MRAWKASRSSCWGRRPWWQSQGCFCESLMRTRRTMRRFQILNDIADVSDHDPTLAGALEAIGRIVVPELADFGMIDLNNGATASSGSPSGSGPGGGWKVVRRGLSERRPSRPARRSRPAAFEAQRASPASSSGCPRKTCVPPSPTTRPTSSSCAASRSARRDHASAAGPGPGRGPSLSPSPGPRRRYSAGRRRLHARPRGPRRPCPRQRRPLQGPGARRAGARGDRRDPAAGPVAAAAPPHPRLVGRRHVPARGGAERGRR